MTPMRRDLALAGVILALYAVLAIGYAVRTPAWQTPRRAGALQLHCPDR